MRRTEEISKPQALNQYLSNRELKEGRRSGILTTEDIYHMVSPDSKQYKNARNELIRGEQLQGM